MQVIEDSRYILTILVISLITGCSTVKSGIERTTAKINELSEKFQRSIREPGESMVNSVEQTNRNYTCSKYRSYQLFFEELDIVPSTISYGEEINQRLQYSLCSPGSQTIKGSITRKIIYDNSVIFSDYESYNYKPGTWIVDVFIEVPNEATTGDYKMEVLLKYGNKSVSETRGFVVRQRK